MKKKLTAILVATLMILTNAAFYISASAEGNVPALIYSCLDFEEQTAGDSPYGFTFGAGNGSMTVINDSGNKAVRLTYAGDGDIPTMILPLQYAPIAESFVIGFRFKCDNSSATQRLMVRTDALLPRNSLYLDSTGEAFNLMSVTGGSLHVGTSSTTRRVSNNTWYDLEMAVNPTTKRMNVYLNNSLMVSNANVTNASFTNIASFTFFAPNKSAGWSIDDFRLYLGGRLSSSDFSEQKTLYENSEIIPDHKFELGRLYQYDKFMFVTLYNKFVARVDGGRYYKNNAYHTMAAAVTESDGSIYVPAADFASALGGSASVENGTVTVTKGGNNTQITDIIYNNEIACVPLDGLAEFLGISYYRQGDLLSFGEALTCPFSLGAMGKNQRGCTMEEEVFERIANSLVYDRPSKERVLQAFETNNPQHAYPRILINDFSEIINNRSRDAGYDSTVSALITRADNYVNQDPVAYTKSDGLRGDFAQPLADRGTYLSFAYKVTGDVKYKNALWSNVEAVAAFPDLNPNHFLDVGISANGIKFAYDWLYDDWTPQQRQTLETIMIDKILTPALAAYRSPLGTNATGFAYNTGNQPIIINCGVAGCALSLMDKYPDMSSEIVSCALRSVETCLEEFAPDGAWTEGVAYWQDTMGSLPTLVDVFRTALGDDYGLLDTPGLYKSAYFPLAMYGATGTFPVGDDASVTPYHQSLMWFANVYNDKALATMRKNALNGPGLTDVVNWVFDADPEHTTIDGDHYFRKMETATMRTGWNSNDTAVLLHGGQNNSNHGHIDNGAFQIDMLGERWACEVPKEEYNILYYGSYTYDPSAPSSPYEPEDYYRYKAEGHNTVIANLGAERADQAQDAFAEILEYTSKPDKAYAILDMTQTNCLYEDAKRGLMLDKGNDAVIIQDDFKASEAAEFWWFMHTQANISLSADGKTAILSKNDKRIWVSIISSGNETFQIMDAEPMEGYYDIPPLQSSNTGYKKLAVRETTDEFKLTVAVKALSGNATQPEIIPVSRPMETWGNDEVTVEDTDDYIVKGIAGGDRFALSEAVASAQKVYVVDAGAEGITPQAASNLIAAYFYVDGRLEETVSSAPYCYEVPVSGGSHTLEVFVRKNDGILYRVGTYGYSAEVLTDTADSVINNFDSETPGSAVTFGSERSFATGESCTYETAPGGSTAIRFSSTAGSGTSYIITDSVAVPDSKLVTFDYDTYAANSSGNMLTHHLRNGVPGYTFGTLGSSKTAKDMWHHVSYIFDFESLTFRGYLDGYEMERGTLIGVTSNKIRFYMTRYTDAAVVYVDNFKYCGKTGTQSVAVEPTEYAVKGIINGERIPVCTKASSLKRTISIVDSAASGKTVTEAANLSKAEFYIDGVLKGTVTASPCQWDMPITDLNQHSLTVTATDIGGNTQTFGPLTFSAVNMEDDSTSHKQYFDGIAGNSLTLAGLPRMNASSSSTENPEYAEIAGGTGTVLKLTGTSGKSSNYQTAQDIHVPSNGIVTIDLDFYCTQSNANHKLYFRSRNSSGYNMKNGDLTLIDGLSMGDLTPNTWHHISFIFDISSMTYVFFLDGYEIERGIMDSRIADRNIYFQIATQNYGSCQWYFDNIEVLAKSAVSKVSGDLADEGNNAGVLVLNSTAAPKQIYVYHAEYVEDELVYVFADSTIVGKGGIWQGSVSAVPGIGDSASVYLWDSDLVPLSGKIVKQGME